ncbi:Hsp20/alpha crystallin family protein [Aminithiophilus ramosus]|uniref:Hsp20/alpha crystallin family protein n=2 Tax=Synergistales TaxID=649776 RepID=A0A9Q7EZH4_9BACT|nr:Hsp20/alpha crystallin family protein [Aminithiophilus ramosus]QTX32202.1 Hsp20/alpha crystallin family protein [Aminithiophilus ramosus]QVL36070.1 Hsp20/alpha crystallin family protein [Synergistota bacterium]
MRSLVRWSRPSALSVFPEVDDFFRSFGNLYSAAGRDLPIEIYEEGDDLFVKVDAPGLAPEDVEIRLFPDHLVLKGKSQSEEPQGEKEGRTYHCCRRRSEVNYSLSLPTEVDADRAEAKFENGVVSLRLPKKAKEEGRLLQLKG